MSKVSGENTEEVLKDLCKENFVVNAIKSRDVKTKPPKTFITSTLQQEANNKWRMSPKITMSIAQNLYVKGVITYPRVDSHNVAEEKVIEIRHFIETKYGVEYLGPEEKEVVKVKNSQDAHECIRPVNVELEDLDDTYTDQEKRMYELIYKRTIASFMSDNITSKTSFKIKNGIHIFEATGIKVVFDGWKRIYKPEDKVDIKLDLDNRVNYEKIIGKEKVVLCPKGIIQRQV